MAGKDAAKGESGRSRLRLVAEGIGLALALMWGEEIVDRLLLGGRLDQYGIRPLRLDGLDGILFAPFLHADFAHLASNTVPFAVLGGLVLWRGLGQWLGASAIIMLIGGLGTWLLGGSQSVHIGASGLIFGYLGFLLVAGFFERSFAGAALAVAIGFLYGGLLWGVLPGKPGISWQGHLFGFAGGLVAARLIAKPRLAPA